MNETDPIVAGIELGGTKCIAALARGRTIVEQRRFATETPDATLARLVETVRGWASDHRVAAIGIASFGPLALDPADRAFGRITSTPKPGWAGTDVRGAFASEFDLPIGFDTDVAGAALAEGLWGAAQGCDVHVYLTVGTGVGAGVVVDGSPVHGLVHPEIGHLRLRRMAGDTFAGACPFHGDCLEGIISGPALAARTGSASDVLPGDDPVWAIVAHSLGELVATLMLALSPRRIVIGGGVGAAAAPLLPAICRHAADALAGYVAGLNAGRLQAIVVAPALGSEAGPLGAIALALDARTADAFR